MTGRADIRHDDPTRFAIVATAILLSLAAAITPLAAAAQRPGAADTVVIGYLTQEEEPPIPLSFLDPILTDEGLQGARLALSDNKSTGRFLGQDFTLREVVVPIDGDPAAGFRELTAEGVNLIVADLPADDLLTVADLDEAADMLLLNARPRDDRLRNADCRANVLHTIPSRAMLADGLAQYLVVKRWTRWFLVVGRHQPDRLFADAMRRAAQRYRAEIVEEKDWTFEAGNARVDTGHVTLQRTVPAFSRAADHDVVIVADEMNEFGEYFSHRTFLPRPVAGTQGLVPTAWSRVFEQWGGTQLHSRFQRQAGRWMTERDYSAWMAVRAIGEAATRAGSVEPGVIANYIRGPDFELAAFKGQGLTFREWDGQLRQPVPLTGPRILVSVSPQEGFLHPFSELDTLGHDRPESDCRK
ncbi:MAG: ABC transporter substrate-binding protein [Inquilinus sp.]|nr:ABC transporter substrate-binding protein [Inquilinus sp.]